MSELRGLHSAERVGEYRDLGWWTDETIDQVFRDQVADRPNQVALVDPANREAIVGSAPRRLTWAQLDAEVEWLAARLLERGLRRGDVLGVQLPNGIELVETYLAAWTIGVVISPLAVQYREHEIRAMAEKGRFVGLLTAGAIGDRHPAAEAEVLRAGLPGLRWVATIGAESESVHEQHSSIDHLVPTSASDDDREAVAELRAADPVDPNDLVTICWTSGTEGLPKGVMRAHCDWLAFSWATLDAPQLTGDDVILNPFPMINMAGICGVMLPWLRSGAVLVQHHPFDAPTFFGQLSQERITYTLAPPALLWMLLNNEALLSSLDLSSLTRMGSGSAPLQPAMVRGWQERFGIGIINFFGSNEGIGLLSSVEDFPDPDDRAQFFPRYGAPGTSWSSRMSEWVSLKLADLATGEEITEPGVRGELRIKGPFLFGGYVDGESLPSALDDDGYLKTGDVFEIAGDRQQFLRYVDRAKELVIRGGMNISPTELEGLIMMHPAVAEVAVVGQPDETLGERVAVFVALAPDATLGLDELVQFLRERKIASFKLPEHLEVLPALPRNPVGKLLKREMKDSLTPA